MESPQKLAFTTLDVFTTTRYAGNPLAIIHVPSDTILSQAQKQRIAAEFNLSETVFLHEPKESVYGLDIFMQTGELPFAGHPTVGSGWYIHSQLDGAEETNPVLRTKSGDIPVSKDESGRVTVNVPFDFKVHPALKHDQLKAGQQDLKDGDYANGLGGVEAFASIVKGMTFALVELTSEDALSRMQVTPDRLSLPEGYLGAWDGFMGIYAFYKTNDGVYRTRMIDGMLEDPATGSAASTLAGWLALQSGKNERINIVQGVEMGRRSEITVDVQVENGALKGIALSGEAVKVMEGSILV